MLDVGMDFEHGQEFLRERTWRRDPGSDRSNNFCLGKSSLGLIQLPRNGPFRGLLQVYSSGLFRSHLSTKMSVGFGPAWNSNRLETTFPTLLRPGRKPHLPPFGSHPALAQDDKRAWLQPRETERGLKEWRSDKAGGIVLERLFSLNLRT